jgi:hypothetical protein
MADSFASENHQTNNQGRKRLQQDRQKQRHKEISSDAHNVHANDTMSRGMTGTHEALSRLSLTGTALSANYSNSDVSRMLKQSTAAVATRREDHHLPTSGRAVLHRRSGRDCER